MKSYRELDVWQRSMDLVQEAYAVTRLLPADERYGLMSQIQRAAVSVPANIAEGYGRSHLGDYLHHLSIARGSLMELETLLTVAGRLKYLTRSQATQAWRLSQSVGKMLTRLIMSLKDTKQKM